MHEAIVDSLTLKQVNLSTRWPSESPVYLLPTTTIQAHKIPVLSSITRGGGKLGDLDRLPLELQQHMMRELDCWSLVNLLKTCSRGLEVVQSLKEYCILLQDAGLALAAKDSARQLSRYSVQQLYTLVQDTDCTHCEEEVAPFLDLTVCQRLCYGCFWPIRGNLLGGNYAVFVKRQTFSRERTAAFPSKKHQRRMKRRLQLQAG